MAGCERMGAVDIRHSTLNSPDATRLIAALNAELTAMFPEPGATHFSLIGEQVGTGDGALLVAYLDNAAVGCGAVRRLDATTAELKRMHAPGAGDSVVQDDGLCAHPAIRRVPRLSEHQPLFWEIGRLKRACRLQCRGEAALAAP